MSAKEQSGPTTAQPPLTRRARLSLRRLRPAQLFDAWTFAETEAWLALAAWRLARSHEKAAAYAAYRAALEREVHAARLLELRLAPAAA
jgi:cytochrome oxidase assembly protein ShyY1